VSVIPSTAFVDPNDFLISRSASADSMKILV
jgi:hypothetical protein